MQKGTTGGSLGGTEVSAARQKRDRLRRERENQQWASKASDVGARKMTAEDYARFEARKGQGHRR